MYGEQECSQIRVVCEDGGKKCRGLGVERSMKA